jgi:elongator complex protein 1
MIERGSRIVCCSDGRVVFQLPRGNLETIYPKIVSLYRVKDCIDHREYLKAL